MVKSWQWHINNNEQHASSNFLHLNVIDGAGECVFAIEIELTCLEIGHQRLEDDQAHSRSSRCSTSIQKQLSTSKHYKGCSAKSLWYLDRVIQDDTTAQDTARSKSGTIDWPTMTKVMLLSTLQVQVVCFIDRLNRIQDHSHGESLEVKEY